MVGQRFVREGFAARAQQVIHGTVPTGTTPRVLGLDEFSLKRGGGRCETILWDQEQRQVRDVGTGGTGRQGGPPSTRSLTPTEGRW